MKSFLIFVIFFAIGFVIGIRPARWWASRGSRNSKARTCPQRGCTQTDGKPCAYRACPNREAQP